MSTMRAKMVVTGVDSHETCEQLRFSAVGANSYPSDGADEDNSFARWTPSANLTMSITSPDLFGKLKVGDKFYVDFTPAA